MGKHDMNYSNSKDAFEVRFNPKHLRLQMF